jgi:hypothetical protein
MYTQKVINDAIMSKTNFGLVLDVLKRS